MKKFIFLISLIIIQNNYSFSDETNCDDFKKYSSEYFNCKAKMIKHKAALIGKEIIKDTKDYQKKNIEDGKKQIGNTKKQIENKKDEVLNK